MTRQFYAAKARTDKNTRKPSPTVEESMFARYVIKRNSSMVLPAEPPLTRPSTANGATTAPKLDTEFATPTPVVRTAVGYTWVVPAPASCTAVTLTKQS